MGTVEMDLATTTGASYRGTRDVARSVIAVAAAVTAVWATAAVASSDWVAEPYDRATAVMAIAPAWLLPLAGSALWHLRPTSRAGDATVALGLAWGAWVAMSASGAGLAMWSIVPLVLVRPLAFWLVLSWPGGRLDRGPVLALSVYAALEVVLWGVVPILFDPYFEPFDYENPVAVADFPRLVGAAGAVAITLVIPAGAVALAVALTRRHRRLPPTSRYLDAPVRAAGLLLAAGELVLFAADHLDAVIRDEDGHWTVAGMLIVGIDWVRFSVLALLLAVGGFRMRQLAVSSPPLRTLDLGAASAPTTLAAAIGTAIGDPTARLLFRDGDGWIDAEGRPADPEAAGRAVVLVRREGEPLAAIERSADAPVRAAALEAAVGAAGSAIDLERTEARARAARDQARRARRALVEVGDEARRRIRRDLHDGAQQQLVGLALHLRLAAGDESTDASSAHLATELAAGVEQARSDVWRLVEGDPPVTGGHDLDGALAELASTVPLPVQVEVVVPDELADATRSTAWFVASEATSNAVKHSGASRLVFDGRVRSGCFVLTVTDDGRGGADPGGHGLSGLRQRVERIGGRLAVDSAPGAGTCIRAELPVGGAP